MVGKTIILIKTEPTKMPVACLKENSFCLLVLAWELWSVLSLNGKAKYWYWASLTWSPPTTCQSMSPPSLPTTTGLPSDEETVAVVVARVARRRMTDMLDLVNRLEV